MDPTRDILFRNFLLNDQDIKDSIIAGNGIGAGITGSVVDDMDFSDVDVIQYLEKRSEQDGMDAGKPFLGARRVRMSGTLYGTDRNLLYDAMWSLRAALNPVLAERESPGDMGYLPLYFGVPTNRANDYPAGAIDLMVRLLPRAISMPIHRDAQGGEDNDSLALPWQATFIGKDPGIYAQSPQDYDLEHAASAITGNTVNRGSYICPVSMLFVVPSSSGTIACSVGNSVFTITVPSSAGSRIIRFKGPDKVITIEEASVELPRRDILPLDIEWPYIPQAALADGNTGTAFTITPSMALGAGSHMWFYEQYA